MNRTIALLCRLLLGLGFTVFGIDFFLHFLPPMGEPSAEGMAFLEALFATGYFFPVLKTLEAVAGLMLLAGFWVPVALLVLLPILLNIVLYHVLLDPNGLVLALVLAVLELALLWHWRDAYRGLFTSRTDPVG